MKHALTLALTVLAVLPSFAGERWRMRYFYEGGDGEFVITSLVFPSAQRGMATGFLDTGDKAKPYAVTTADGGAKWTPLRVPDAGGALFFLNEQAGWLAADNTIWFTPDFGATWKKLARVPGVLQVYFVDERHGWAVGEKKLIRETTDGGATWNDVPAAAEPKTTPDYTTYQAISFANAKAGMICGASRPPRRGRRERPNLPEWMEPDTAVREVPEIGLMLSTKDAGMHWTLSETSMFGQVTDVSLAPDGRGLAVVEFFGRFDYPSEVYRIDGLTGKAARVFRRKDRAVTDALVPAQGPAYLAAFEPTGTYFRSPVPGKLKILKSTDLEEWQDMDVDYRALARRAVLASAGGSHFWAATDTGMILQLTTE